jgi:hypothetical protein
MPACSRSEWAGAARVRGVVNVEAVDADELGSTVDEVLRAGLGEVGGVCSVLWGAPVAVPAGVDQDRAALADGA